MNKLVLNQREFNGHVLEICRSITNSNWRPDYVVGITRGGLLPALMISHYLEVPMHTLNVSLRDNGTELGPESNLWMAEDAFGYIQEENRKENGGWTSLEKFRKKILIVDDINDSGATINWIMDDWQSGCLPNDENWSNIWNNNVKFAVVVDNVASKCNVKMDYWSLEVNKAEKDIWIEFPYEEWWTK